MSDAQKWQEFDAVKDEALLAWLHERWNGQKGGIAQAKDRPFGEAGLLRWDSLRSNLVWGGVVAGFLITGMAGVIVSGAALALTFLPNSCAAARSLLGGTASWKKGRENGLGPLAAFAVTCKRQAMAIASTAPVSLPWDLPYEGMRYGRNGLAYTQQKLGSLGMEKASQALDQAVDCLDRKLESLDERIEAAEDWQAGLLVKIAQMDGASSFQAQEVYDELARLRMQCRWDIFLDIKTAELEKNQESSSKGLISDQEEILLSLTAKLVDQKQLHSESLPLILEKIEAAKLPAWFKPRPEMPSLLEMARSVGEWHRYHFNEAPPDGIQKMQAAMEARDIQGFVGEASPFALVKSKAARANRL